MTVCCLGDLMLVSLLLVRTCSANEETVLSAITSLIYMHCPGTKEGTLGGGRRGGEGRGGRRGGEGRGGRTGGEGRGKEGRGGERRGREGRGGRTGGEGRGKEGRGGERRGRKVEGWWESKGGRGERRGNGRESSPQPCDMTYTVICNMSTNETVSL